MNKLDAKNKAYLYATGKSPAPTTGSKAAKLEGLCATFYTAWQTEPGMEWNSLSDDISAGTVTPTDTFTLAQPVWFLSQKEKARVRVVLNGQTTYYHIVDPSNLAAYEGQKACALIGSTEIQFATPFPSDSPLLGGQILAPAITKLPDLENDTDTVLIDQPEYLPWRMAAHYALTDRQLNYLADDLLAQANEFMISMKLANTPEAEQTSSSGIDYFGTMGNVGTGVVGDGGSRTDTIFS